MESRVTLKEQEARNQQKRNERSLSEYTSVSKWLKASRDPFVAPLETLGIIKIGPAETLNGLAGGGRASRRLNYERLYISKWPHRRHLSPFHAALFARLYRDVKSTLSGGS